MSIDKFESVCQELNSALQREQQAQQLLVEQSRQLEEITLRLDLYTTEGMEKEQTLSEAVHVSSGGERGGGGERKIFRLCQKPSPKIPTDRRKNSPR